jgi:hypothetical protein
MAITYHDLTSGAITDATTYQGQLYLMLCEFECATPGVPDTTIYDDKKANSNPLLANNPTIGVGFNLRAQLLPVMRAYFGSTTFDTAASATYTQDKNLMSSLGAIMKESWAGAANVSSRTTEVINAINKYYAAIDPNNPNPTTISSF